MYSGFWAQRSYYLRLLGYFDAQGIITEIKGRLQGLGGQVGDCDLGFRVDEGPRIRDLQCSRCDEG